MSQLPNTYYISIPRCPSIDASRLSLQDEASLPSSSEVMLSEKCYKREGCKFPLRLVTVASQSIEAPLEYPEYSSGGIKLTASGIGTIPEKIESSSITQPTFIPCEVDCGSETNSCFHPPRSIISYHPRYSQEAIIIMSEIGRGTSSVVHKCIYVPTLSFVAVRFSRFLHTQYLEVKI